MHSYLKSEAEVFHNIFYVEENVDFKKFTKLVPYLKKKLSVGNHPKKSKEANQFIRETDDETHLVVKVVLILGISGACRREELTKMTVDDIEDKDSILIVKLPDTKTNIQRIFTVSNLDYNIDIYRKYAALRPSYATSRRLCFNQVVEINCTGKMPSLISKIPKITKF
ncbi:hypothetical protein NQ317_017080 [Molorchus minor]|uniref:Tyr recombinase domain-containing protein n=1 Tax=Molorchus minor TaxID=1323400 RepID=A0ABQ9K756_9CUCU|nr:hypothetical protein NQ317_017080 [Molorchus minor]